MGRKIIDMEYVHLEQFYGEYGDDTFTLRFKFDDPDAYKVFGLKPYCQKFEIFVDYCRYGEVGDVRITYYDGVDYVGKVKKSFMFYKNELQCLKEMPTVYGFDEKCAYA